MNNDAWTKFIDIHDLTVGTAI